MPTGYTAGILDGEIKTFSQFAKTCMRAFGATIHMRDEPNNKEYEPRKESSYHAKEIAKAKKILRYVKSLSDEQIKNKRIQEFNKSYANYNKYIKKSNKDRKKLEVILSEIRAWTPPTSEHQNFKKFMDEQITGTIDHDCKNDYWEEKLAEINNGLSNINISEARKEMISNAKWNIDYHTKEKKREVESCDDSNKWVTDLLNSI